MLCENECEFHISGPDMHNNIFNMYYDQEHNNMLKQIH